MTKENTNLWKEQSPSLQTPQDEHFQHRAGGNTSKWEKKAEDINKKRGRMERTLTIISAIILWIVVRVAHWVIAEVIPAYEEKLHVASIYKEITKSQDSRASLDIEKIKIEQEIKDRQEQIEVIVALQNDYNEYAEQQREELCKNFKKYAEEKYGLTCNTENEAVDELLGLLREM